MPGSANATFVISQAEDHPANSPPRMSFGPAPSDESYTLPSEPEAAPPHSTETDKEPAPLTEPPLTERLPPRARISALDEPPTAETIAVFGDAIAVHLGPVGRVMTARKAKTCSSLADLLAALEREIPSSTEQHVFRSRIKRQFEP